MINSSQHAINLIVAYFFGKLVVLKK